MPARPGRHELADWVHISAASLWLGGLVALAVAVWPVAPELRRWAFFRFSRVAVVLVGLVLAAGTYLSLVRVPHLSDLWTQRYGVVLLVKISLVALAVAWGAVHHFVVRPRLAGAGPATGSRVGRSLLGESMVGVAVLLMAAILVDSKPPPRPASSPTVAQAPRIGEQLAQARGVRGRRRLVLVPEVDIGRRAQAGGQLPKVGVGVGRLAQAYITVRLGLEVVHRDDPGRARP